MTKSRLYVTKTSTTEQSIGMKKTSIASQMPNKNSFLNRNVHDYDFMNAKFSDWKTFSYYIFE